MYQLHLIGGLQSQYVINLRTGANSIGRTSENNIILDHPTVSDEHAIIQVKGENVYIEDRDSKNGTYVNGVPVKDSVALNDGDKIFFGTTVEARFSIGAEHEDLETKQIDSPVQRPSSVLRWVGFAVVIVSLVAAAWFFVQSRNPAPEDLSVFVQQTLQAWSAERSEEDSDAAATSPPSPTSTPESTYEEVVSQDFQITELFIASGEQYEVIENGFTSGAKAFIDRDYVIEQYPSYLEGLTFLSTAVGDKFRTEEEFISFTSNVDLSVYISYDVRYAEKPAWLDSFSNVLAQVQMGASGGGTYDLYKRDFPAGKIMIGGNYPAEDAGNYGMYLVILAPSNIEIAPEASASDSGLPSITLDGGTGYIFSSSLLSTGDRDIWWNSVSFSPNPHKMMSLGPVDSILDLPSEINFDNLDLGSFDPAVGEGFVIEISRDGNIDYAALRVLKLADDRSVTFEYIYPLE